jgi:hypothetical protein
MSGLTSAPIPQLSQLEVENSASDEIGVISGQRLAQAVAAFQTDGGEIVASSGFTSTSGYLKLANGIIIQWIYNSSTSGTKLLSYPITFPNRVWHVSMSLVENSQNYQSATHRTDWNTSRSHIDIYNDGEKIEILAIGY